jgi:hypothetical protein
MPGPLSFFSAPKSQVPAPGISPFNLLIQAQQPFPPLFPVPFIAFSVIVGGKNPPKLLSQKCAKYL